MTGISGELRVDGLTRLTADLRKLDAALGDKHDALGEIAQRGARAASSFAPHRSGRLARSIRGTSTKTRATVTAFAPYAGVISYGWPKRHIKPTRFMQRAELVIAASAQDRLEKSVEEDIRKAALR